MKRSKIINGLLIAGLAVSMAFGGVPAGEAFAAAPGIVCEREVAANLVVIDQPLMFNRLGAANVNGMIYALKRDVIDANGVPLTVAGAVPTPGTLQLRPDRRPRPLVLRVRAGDCLTVHLENLLTAVANPFNEIPGAVPPFNIVIDDQPANRFVGFHAAGMQVVTGIDDDGGIAGSNNVLENPVGGVGGLVSPGNATSYKMYAEKEGVFVVNSPGVLIGSEANGGHVPNGLFGQVIVEPRGARIYRSQVHEEELRLSADRNRNGAIDNAERTPDRQPVIDYEALYPNIEPWIGEGKANLPVLNTMRCSTATSCEIVHSEINAVVAGPDPDGTWYGQCPGSNCPYPLESVGKRNPSVPNRLEPFRDFSSQFHDETAAAQAFHGFYVTDPVFSSLLHGVRDSFMINYGSGGIGSEIIANRLGVGPMHDCLNCAYEEFFLSSFTVGDPAMLVDVPANLGLENLLPGFAPPAGTTGPKANYAIGSEDPSNVHHSYTGDFAKIRNTHVGFEQHVFHLHNHQWLFNPNDDDSNYLDAQGIGPGVGYTYEINFGGSGNRNKTAGDSIFHCHFYPHFAQGMWYHWRHNDTLQTGTVLAASNATFVNGDPEMPSGYHTTRWALEDTTPAIHPKAGTIGLPADARFRSYPDGEIVAGTPIPAVVPLPGQGMPLLPGDVAVVPNSLTVAVPGDPARPVGSLARVIDRTVHPGYPFWIAGIEDIVGQRATTPPLDMLSATQATALKADATNTFDSCVDNVTGVSTEPVGGACPAGTTLTARNLWDRIDTNQADGFDGGLPRHALLGYAAGGTSSSIVSPIDFSKKVLSAQPTYYPEEGTDLEQLAMKYHAQRHHPSYKVAFDFTPVPANFTLNGSGPVIGAPFNNPCIDDRGVVLDNGVVGSFFDGTLTPNNPEGSLTTTGRSLFTSGNPRIYKGTFVQFDAVLNKVGYHYPQQRIITLWADAGPVITQEKPPEPLVFRANTFDCMVYHNANLVPEYYEMDDYQVRTPTDIIGQHIHLPKWDLTTADGSANGWNYEDGTLSPGAVRERIHAIRTFNGCTEPTDPRDGTGVCPVALDHPYFGAVAQGMGGRFPQVWKGARTTTQRWFADPVVNTSGFDRGLGIIFTHDHYGPSTHQQIGLYATMLTEPAGSQWRHNELGTQLGQDPDGTYGRTLAGITKADGSPATDGGPTSWQAMILPPTTPLAGVSVKSETIDPHREFYFEYSDFQHAYEKGVYVGAGPDGLPLEGAGPLDRFLVTADAPANVAAAATDIQNAFRTAINIHGRAQLANPLFPDVYVEVDGGILPGCPTRPCPGAITAANDPAMHVVNYRNEPVALRVFDPNRLGPDGKPGAQAAGRPGNLAFALNTALIHRSTGAVTRIPRAIPEMNLKESALGFWAESLNQQTAIDNNDPFTPMMRAYAGDLVRIKMQSGGHEQEHTATVHGLKWLQSGSGNGRALNSGWRNAQSGGISEQFTLSVPLVGAVREFSSCGVDSTGPVCLTPRRDYAYSMDTATDGWWSGTWGILRGYDVVRGDLPTLPGNPRTAAPSVVNAADFRGICPKEPTAPTVAVNIVAALANDILPNPGITLPLLTDTNPVTGLPFSVEVNSTASLNPAGGTLVYNPRTTVVPTVTIPGEAGDPPLVIGGGAGPLNDPTAMMYVRATDLEPKTPVAAPCLDNVGAVRADFFTRIGCPVQLKTGLKAEPLVLRAPAGSCVIATLHNRIPAQIPDLPTMTVMSGYAKRDRLHPQGSTNFNINLLRPSSHVGLHTQMAAFDVTKDDGVNVGQNFDQVAQPVGAGDTVAATDVYKWYLGDIGVKTVAGGFQLVATPVEFGGSSFIPADKIKQPQKSMMGGMVTLPAGSTILQEDRGDNVPNSGRVAATIQKADGSVVRDFMVILAKNVDQRYADGTPVQHMSGAGVGIPEDSANNSTMALNYGIEPMWFRFAIPPHSLFGPLGFGGILNAQQAFSNTLPTDPNVPFSPAVGDPATPVLVASSGQEVRLHFASPHGTNRGSTMALHGHVWQRDPYICPGEAQDGLPGRCNRPDDGRLVDAAGNWVVGSKAIGINPTGMTMAAQESLASYTKYDLLLPYAGGRAGHLGDYVFRDTASGGTASGVWGILRVQAEGAPPRATALNLTAVPPGSTTTGDNVTFTATPVGGTGPFEYEFLLSTGGGPFVVVQPYGPSNQWLWNTLGTLINDFQVRAFVRTVGNPGFDALATIPYTLTAAPITVSLSANPVDNTTTGNSVTFTATGAGGQGGGLEYEFRHRAAGGVFAIVQNYSDNNVWVWNTTGSPAGSYEIQVLVRDAGTITPSASAILPYVLTEVSPATGVSFTPPPSPASPVAPGDSVVFTAVASGGTAPYEYQYWVFNGSTWTTPQLYGPSGSFTWNTTGLSTGTYTIVVWARSVGSVNQFDTSATAVYVVQ